MTIVYGGNMMRQLFALAIAVFVLGWLSHILYANIGTVEATPLQSNGDSVQAAEQLSSDFTLPSTGREKPSPTDRLKLADVHVTDNTVVIDGVRGRSFETAIFSDTNSMDPIIDEGSQAIQIVPLTTEDIQVGDIISYDSGQYGIIIHRVIQIADDSNGWYAVVKGDNNPSADPIKVRFGMIKRVLVGVIY